MNIRTFTGSLSQTTSLVAISALGSLFSLPALAGGTLPDPMAKPSSAPMSAPVSAPISDSTTKPTTSQTAPAPASKVVPTSTKPGESKTSATETATNAGNIVDVAMSNGSFNTLLTAVKAAGLTDVLTGTGPYTVFAPTDEAFAALPKGTVEMLLKPENLAKLKKVLTYHVISGTVNSTAKSGQVKTVEGSSVVLKSMQGGMMVNNAKVMAADIKASNGVIHAIDKVILPPDL